jgi:hypothetical protein
VRRAFLCGSEPLTGFNFEHRRQWIVDRIKLMCSVFAVDLCAYAIMNNHIVVRINSALVDEWTDEEVAHRWMQVFSGPLLMHQFLANADLTKVELKCIAELFVTFHDQSAVITPKDSGWADFPPGVAGQVWGAFFSTLSSSLILTNNTSFCTNRRLTHTRLMVPVSK